MVALIELRVCRDCGKKAFDEKDLELFTKRKNLPYGRNTICKQCTQKRQHNYRKGVKYLNTKRAYEVGIRYNITIDEYISCMNTSPVCQHCGSKESLCYDHDHNTGKFRGVLCRKCNSALGKLGDTLQSIEKMYIYLGGVPLKH